MANQYQSTAQTGILKQLFQGPIVDQFNQDVPIWRGASKGNFPWSGQFVNRPLKVRRNPGVGSTTDGGNLPKVGRQTTVQAAIYAKYLYGRGGISGPMLAASKNDAGAFVRGFSFEVESLTDDIKSQANRQMTWDGTGDLARVNTAAAASTSLVIKGREDGEPAMKFVDVDMMFDLYTSANVLVQSGLTINSISGSPSDTTVTLTLDQVVTTSANDILVLSGSGVNTEIQGLLTQLDGGTSTVFGIDRSSYQATQGNVIFQTSTGATGGSSIALTLDVIQRLLDETQRRGGEVVNALYCDYSTRRMYNKLLVADRRYVGSVVGDGTFAKKGEPHLEFGGIPIVADKDCPVRLFALTGKYIEKYTLSELALAEDTGAPMIAAAENDQLEFRIRMFANLFNSKASACGVLTQYSAP